MNKVSGSFPGSQLAVLGITDDDLKTAAAITNRLEVAFPTLLDEEQRALRAFQVQMIPRKLIVDRQGVIRSDLLGALSEEELREELGKVGVK